MKIASELNEKIDRNNMPMAPAIIPQQIAGGIGYVTCNAG
jgi:hypothetical protein